MAPKDLSSTDYGTHGRWLEAIHYWKWKIRITLLVLTRNFPQENTMNMIQNDWVLVSALNSFESEKNRRRHKIEFITEDPLVLFGQTPCMEYVIHGLALGFYYWDLDDFVRNQFNYLKPNILQHTFNMGSHVEDRVAIVVGATVSSIPRTKRYSKQKLTSNYCSLAWGLILHKIFSNEDGNLLV